MRIYTRKGALAIGVALAVATLAGCTAAPSTTGEEITFVTWVGGDAGVKWENLAASYEESTGTKVNIEIVPSDSYDQVVSSRIEAGNSPDLIETITEKQPGYVDGGLLADLSDQEWVANGIPAVQQFADQFDGKTYAFIPALDVAGVFYNQDIFDAQGLSVPTTWDEFTEVVTSLRAAGITPLAVGAKDGWPLSVQANQMGTGALRGTDEADALRSGELTYSDSLWAQTVADWNTLIGEGAYDPQVLGIDWPSSATQFATGDAAMLIQGSFALPAVRETSPDMNVSLFALPYPQNSEPVASVSFGSMLAIPTGAKHLSAAEDFLKFLADPANLTPFLADAKAFSGITGVTSKLDPALDAIAPLVESNSTEYNIAPGLSTSVSAALVTGIQGLLGGTTTVADVLASMDLAQANN